MTNDKSGSNSAELNEETVADLESDGDVAGGQVALTDPQCSTLGCTGNTTGYCSTKAYCYTYAPHCP